MKNIKHIAVIPDGNRRWAKRRGMPSFTAGMSYKDLIEKILQAALEMEVPYFTFWGTSADNIKKRSPEEVSFLFGLFAEYFAKLLQRVELEKNEIRVNFFGRWREVFHENVKKVIEELIEKTKNYNKMQLTFLLAYSGLDEMEDAIRKIAEAGSKNQELDINVETVKQHLWTNDLPPVDLVIRTGGEPHWSSGFMMWDTAESQLYFTETLWPDFSPEEFKKAIEAASGVERRFGK